ncbi:MAG TPA: DUF2971 domain-containing protein [Usitatibacter sp.]|nr:DUF2971 domain-containing protein [Usitatibacter sp.]
MKSAAITIDRLASAFDATPPGHLFHYTDLEGVKGIFTSRTLWLSKFTATNDISEIKLAIEHFQSFAARRARALESAEGMFLREAAEQLEGFRRTNICLASFCEQHDLLSQWRSYGNDGRGVALGFNSARLLDVAQRNGLRLLRCVYEPAEHERISASLSDMLLEARRTASPEESAELIAQFNEVFLRVAPVIKDHRFGEEREWRLVSTPVAFDHPAIIAVLKGNQASVKLTVKLTGDSEGMSNMIPRITIGPTLDPHNVSDAIDVLSQRNGFHISSMGISEIPYRRIAE